MLPAFRHGARTSTGAAACGDALLPGRRDHLCRRVAVLQGRVRRTPRMRLPGPRVLAPALWGLRAGLAAGLKSQAPRLLPVVLCAAHGTDCGAPGGPCVFQADRAPVANRPLCTCRSRVSGCAAMRSLSERIRPSEMGRYPPTAHPAPAQGQPALTQLPLRHALCVFQPMADSVSV